MKYCQDCGTKLRENSKFCEGCGKKILFQKEYEKEIEEKYRKNLEEKVRKEIEEENKSRYEKYFSWENPNHHDLRQFLGKPQLRDLPANNFYTKYYYFLHN